MSVALGGNGGLHVCDSSEGTMSVALGGNSALRVSDGRRSRSRLGGTTATATTTTTTTTTTTLASRGLGGTALSGGGSGDIKTVFVLLDGRLDRMGLGRAGGGRNRGSGTGLLLPTRLCGSLLSNDGGGELRFDLGGWLSVLRGGGHGRSSSLLGATRTTTRFARDLGASALSLNTMMDGLGRVLLVDHLTIVTKKVLGSGNTGVGLVLGEVIDPILENLKVDVRAIGKGLVQDANRATLDGTEITKQLASCLTVLGNSLGPVTPTAKAERGDHISEMNGVKAR